MFEVTCRYQDGAPTLVVTGPLRDADLPGFRAVLDGLEGDRSVAVDLTRASDIGPTIDRLLRSRGLHVLRPDPEVLASRATIETAKGILMASVGCDENAAFRLLVEQSQHENRKLREIAAELVARQEGSRLEGAAPA